jgi:hypothetical protein
MTRDDAIRNDRLLAAASAAQLAVNVAGLVVALKRRRAYDFLVLHGRPENVARDAIWMGTALSAPAPMLVAQSWAITRLRRDASDRERLVLGGLGAAMIGGYLGEALVRKRLRPSGWDAVESPVAAAGLALAATMAVVARAGWERDHR